MEPPGLLEPGVVLPVLAFLLLLILAMPGTSRAVESETTCADLKREGKIVDVDLPVFDAQTRQTLDADKNRFAFVVGVQTYAVSPLTKTLQDACSVERILKNANFKVTTVLDGGIKEISGKFQEFLNNLKNAGRSKAVVYFSGHGTHFNERNWLLPADFPKKAGEWAYQPKYAMAGSDLLAKARQASPSSEIWMILDACRDNKFSKGRKTQEVGLQLTKIPEAGAITIEQGDVVVLYATKLGAVATEGGADQRHSNLTEAFVQVVTDGAGMTPSDLSLGIGRVVKKLTANFQAPKIDMEPGTYRSSFHVIPAFARPPPPRQPPGPEEDENRDLPDQKRGPGPGGSPELKRVEPPPPAREPTVLTLSSPTPGAIAIIDGTEKLTDLSSPGQYIKDRFVGDSIFVRVQAPDYKPFEKPYRFTKRVDELDVPLDPNFGYVSVKAVPEDAKAWLLPVGTTELSADPVATQGAIAQPTDGSPKRIVGLGPRALFVMHPLYHRHRERVMVLPDQTVERTVDLAAAHGRLAIQTGHANATIEIAGEAAGSGGSLTRDQHPSGRYRVRITAPCHDPWEDHVDIRDNQSTEVEVELVRRCHRIVVPPELTPKNATVAVSNAYGELIKAQTGPSNLDVEPGDYVLSVDADGYERIEFRQATFPAYGITALPKEGRRLARSRGTVLITTDPPLERFEILVDDVPVEFSRELQLDAGERQISIRTTQLEGKKIVNIFHDKNYKLKIIMKKRYKRFGQKFQDCNIIGKKGSNICPDMVIISPGFRRLADQSGDWYFVWKPLAISVREVSMSSYAEFVWETGREHEGACAEFVFDENKLESYPFESVWVRKLQYSVWSNRFFAGGVGPAVCVKWSDAYDYTRWLSKKTGKSYRLVSDDEWNYIVANFDPPFLPTKCADLQLFWRDVEKHAALAQEKQTKYNRIYDRWARHNNSFIGKIVPRNMTELTGSSPLRDLFYEIQKLRDLEWEKRRIFENVLNKCIVILGIGELLPVIPSSNGSVDRIDKALGLLDSTKEWVSGCIMEIEEKKNCQRMVKGFPDYFKDTAIPKIYNPSSFAIMSDETRFTNIGFRVAREVDEEVRFLDVIRSIFR